MTSRHSHTKQLKVRRIHRDGLTLDRWPVLITKTIADVEETMKADGTPGLQSEGSKIIRDLIALKDDMEQDCPLR